MDSNVQTSQPINQMIEQTQNRIIKEELGKCTPVIAPAKTLAALQGTLDLIIKSSLSDGLTHLIQVRMILEPGIATIAAETATNEDIETMQQAVATMHAVPDDSDVFVEADQAFHLALAKATQNSLLTMLLNLIMDLLREQRGHTFPVNGDVPREQYHYQRILEAVMNHNPTAARQAMIDHLQQILDNSNISVNS